MSLYPRAQELARELARNTNPVSDYRFSFFSATNGVLNEWELGASHRTEDQCVGVLMHDLDDEMVFTFVLSPDGFIVEFPHMTPFFSLYRCGLEGIKIHATVGEAVRAHAHT